MIVFDLGCENGHRFEGWFASNEDFDRQTTDRQLACPLCGSAGVVRLPNAPHIRPGAKERPSRAEPARAAQQYANMGRDVLARAIERIIESTEDVGSAFPEEARRIHYRETPDRRIRGTASSDEVEALKDEGIDVVALPVPAHRLGKTH